MINIFGIESSVSVFCAQLCATVSDLNWVCCTIDSQPLKNIFFCAYREVTTWNLSRSLRRLVAH